MSSRNQKQVHPAASAALILIVLIGVQWVWWRFLVYRAPSPAIAGVPGPGSNAPNDIHLVGRADVYVQTIAGSQAAGDTDGPPHAARFDRPTGIAVDSGGTVYVADTGNSRIRAISPAGDTTTLAGSTPGYADGPVAGALFNAPCGICTAADGSIYVSDTGNGCIRRIKDGQVTTVGSPPPAKADPNAPPHSLPVGIAFVPGAPPHLVIADALGSIRQCALDGAARGEHKTPAPPVAVAGDSVAAAVPRLGDLMIGATTLHNTQFDGSDEITAADAAKVSLKRPVGVAALGKAWLVTDANHPGVALVVNGKAQALAGTYSSGNAVYGFRDGSGRTAFFGTVCGIATDGKRFVYVVDTGNNSIRRIDISETTLP